jgi:enamine deaminase RidA (YjgF/YER057c/UK114 family)
MLNYYCYYYGRKPDGKRQLERPIRKCYDNIKSDLKEVGWACLNWTHVAQDRVQLRTCVNTVMVLRVR